MGNLLDFPLKRKNQFSLEFLRELPLMLDLIEREWRRHRMTPLQQALFRSVHYGLAGLLDLDESGVVTL